MFSHKINPINSPFIHRILENLYKVMNRKQYSGGNNSTIPVYSSHEISAYYTLLYRKR